MTSKFNLKPQDEGYQKLEHGQWVSTLKILDGDDMVLFKQDDFLHLLSPLPNFQTLDLSGSFHSDIYMVMLQGADNTLYFKKIEKIICDTTMDNGYASIGQLSTVRHLRFLIQHIFCNSITTLEMYCYNDCIVCDNISFLSEFKSLAHLGMKESHAVGVTLFDILEYCQNLKSLVFYSSSSAVPGYEDQSYTEMERRLHRKWNTATANTSESSSLVLNKYLQHIDI